MSAPAEDLTRMANQIAAYFDAYGPEEAVAGVLNHLLMFWTAEMREQLMDLASSDAADLTVTVRTAIMRLQQQG